MLFYFIKITLNEASTFLTDSTLFANGTAHFYVKKSELIEGSSEKVSTTNFGK